jgi:hypothetical protein
MERKFEAKPTIYSGSVQMRSKLETQWAAFFDALEIPWEYEKYNFIVHGMGYLPDFYFPGMDLFVEIKPYYPDGTECEKVIAFSVQHPIWLITGAPSVRRLNGVMDFGYEVYPYHNEELSKRHIFVLEGDVLGLKPESFYSDCSSFMEYVDHLKISDPLCERLRKAYQTTGLWGMR